MSATTSAEADRSEIRGLVETLYRAISGHNDADRDWDADSGLYHPQGCVVPGVFEDRPRTVMKPEQYIADARRRLGDRPFFEWEVSHSVELGVNIAYVRSEYAAAETPGGSPIIKSGINHLLLTRTETGWKIAAIAWD